MSMLTENFHYETTLKALDEMKLWIVLYERAIKLI